MTNNGTDGLLDFTWYSPSYLSDLISYHCPFIYYIWIPKFSNPGTFASALSPFPKSTQANIFSLFGSQSKCNLSRETSSDHPIPDDSPTSIHYCPSFYPSFIHSIYHYLKFFQLSIYLAFCLLSFLPRKISVLWHRYLFISTLISPGPRTVSST